MKSVAYMKALLGSAIWVDSPANRVTGTDITGRAISGVGPVSSTKNNHTSA